MNLELTDEKTRALLNLLVEAIEADRYPSRNILSAVGAEHTPSSGSRHPPLVDRLFDRGFDTL